MVNFLEVCEGEKAQEARVQVPEHRSKIALDRLSELGRVD